MRIGSQQKLVNITDAVAGEWNDVFSAAQNPNGIVIQTLALLDMNNDAVFEGNIGLIIGGVLIVVWAKGVTTRNLSLEQPITVPPGVAVQTRRIQTAQVQYIVHVTWDNL